MAPPVPFATFIVPSNPLKTPPREEAYSCVLSCLQHVSEMHGVFTIDSDF